MYGPFRLVSICYCLPSDSRTGWKLPIVILHIENFIKSYGNAHGHSMRYRKCARTNEITDGILNGNDVNKANANCQSCMHATYGCVGKLLCNVCNNVVINIEEQIASYFFLPWMQVHDAGRWQRGFYSKTTSEASETTEDDEKVIGLW